MGKLKKLKAHLIKKKIIIRKYRYRQLLQSKKVEIRKSKRLYKNELTKRIKYSKNLFKYLSNNKKMKMPLN